MDEQRKPQEFLASEPSGLRERPPTAGAKLVGWRVAVIIADGFEQTEFDVPTRRLREAGATVDVIAPDEAHLDHIKGESHGEPSAGTAADKVIGRVSADHYDALVIPGGLRSPDTMRASSAHLAFVRAFVDAKKPIAAICHGPWLLADADALQGRRMTSWPAIRRDVERAGATWQDLEVVQDGNLVFSRRPADAEAFASTFIALLAATARRPG